MSEQTNTTFDEGDVVELASGGPAMVVEMVRGDDNLQCCWFSGDTLVRDTFAPVALKPRKPA